MGPQPSILQLTSKADTPRISEARSPPRLTCPGDVVDDGRHGRLCGALSERGVRCHRMQARAVTKDLRKVL